MDSREVSYHLTGNIISKKVAGRCRTEWHNTCQNSPSCTLL